MKHSSLFLDAIALHYYTRIGDKVVTVHDVDGNERYLRNEENSRGSATDFKEDAWFGIMKSTLHTDTIVKKHSAIMDKYDPEKRVALIVDEWGTWFDCEPGTNPGFLYQQNTMRDALVAGLSLNIFNKHCDRVKMACIAQMVNVLQSVILTEGEKMVLTPTYHVFHQYRHHQDADLVESCITGNSTLDAGEKEYQVPKLQESVSIDKDGIVTITLNNLSTTDSEEVEVAFTELNPSDVSASIVNQEMHAYNTFEEPENVTEEAFTAYEITEKGLKFTIPACSVVAFRVK